MRAPFLSPGATVRLAIFTALALIAATITMLFGHAPDESSLLAHSLFVPSAPLAQELARCSALGLEAEQDQACKDAWAENRRRFFTYRALRAVSEGDAAHPAPIPQKEK